MFKGTEQLSPGEFSRIIAANGGRENAFTGRDYTAYFQRLEKSRLPVAFELEADRMRNLVLQDKEFAKEVNVVMEERRLRTEDKPQSLAYERFQAAAYQTSPYRNPVIGWMNDLQNMEVKDLADWYRDWYAPGNATLVVVGDVKAEEVFKLARETFGQHPASNAVALKPQDEVEQKGLRRIVVKAPAEVPYLLMGYKVPSLKTAEDASDAYALEVLAGVLDGGDSARFARELVRDSQVATSAGAGYDLYARLSTMMLLDGTPGQGREIKELEQALIAQVERIKEEPIDAAELERIKAQVVAEDVYERDSVFYQAMQMGRLETVGLGWQRVDEYVEGIKAVTPEQVQAVARKYLTEDRLTVAVLEPLPMDQAKPRRAGYGGRHDIVR